MTNIKRSVSSFSALVSLIGLAAVATGCSQSVDDETVKPRLAVIDKSRSALSAAGIVSIKGTYGANCGGHPSGTDPWTLSASSPANDTLLVQKNDSNCVLTVRQVVTGDATFDGSPAIALAASFAGEASTFAASGQRSFFANAMISATDMAADFTITVKVSDTASSDHEQDLSSFATQDGSLTATTVAAPTYTIGFGDFTISKDSQNEILSVSGFAQLTAGSATGQDWAIYNGALTSLSSLAAVEEAWADATSGGLLADLTTLQVPASAFNLVTIAPAVDLDASPQRTVIVRNTADGVSSYQLFLITFIP
jgi:hypothetical protein